MKMKDNMLTKVMAISGGSGLCAVIIILTAVLLVSCGGGGGGSPFTPRTVVDIPPAVEPEPEPVPHVVIPPVVVPPVVPPVEEPVVLEQMSKPSECLTVASSTGDYLRPYITCDGVPFAELVSYPFDHNNTEIALISVYAVIDSKLDTEDLTDEEYIQKQFDFANEVFANSGVYIVLQVAGIWEVDVRAGDLSRQFKVFSRGDSEYNGLDERQLEADADYAFLFKARAADPWACGVATLDAHRELMYHRRGVSQCHVGEEFNQTSVTRYYERASITFVHEMGHLMGLDHNVESATTDPLTKYSYGYLLPEFELDLSDEWNGYGTIMSYADKPTYRFSDPSARFTIPETGEYVVLGTSRANAVAHLNRVRYYMSQLHERWGNDQLR